MKKKHCRDERWKMCLKCLGTWVDIGKIAEQCNIIANDSLYDERKKVVIAFESKIRDKYEDNAKWKKPCEGKCPHRLELLVLSQREEKDGLKRIKKTRKRHS